MVYLILALGLVAPADSVYRGDRGEVRVPAQRLEAPELTVDGRLTEPAWSESVVLTGFTQYEPVEGIPATQETEVRVLYTPEAIYFGVLARDDDPSAIRASLTERDQGVLDDDWVRITLDTFDDQNQAYVFYVNPRGIQADGLWVEGAERRFGPPIDFNPDFLWESAGTVTQEGWVAEIRIPYGSLRFREAPEQTWGLNVIREVRRTGYKSSWAPLTANVANQLELSGKLEGLRSLESRRLVELNPVATGRRTGELNDDGVYERDPFRPAIGLNARYGVTRNLVLDATINPDFSQVEADAGRVAVNERFAIFFPEKRPFFLEGTEVFNTPQRLVYTRSIVEPLGGAKLTGKTGAFNVGYLGAVDESPVTFDESDAEAAFNLVRVRRDVGASSNVGALYTDRTLLDGSEYNRVGAVDTRLVAGRYAITAQLAGAWTRDSDDAASRFGQLLNAKVERSGRVFSWQAELEDVDHDFRARSGFIRRVGDAQVSGQVRYQFLNEAGALLEDWGPQLELRAFYDHDDFWAGRRFEEARLEAGFDVSLRGANGFNLRFTDSYFAFDAEDYEDYLIASPAGVTGVVPITLPDPLDHMLGAQIFGRSRPLPWLSFRGRASYGEVPIYAEASRGVELSLGPTAELRFPMGLSADLSFNYSRIHRENGELFSVAQIPRAKVQYQLSRALFARAIIQYDLEDRDALRAPDGTPYLVDGELSTPEDEGEVQYDLLLAYEPSPGTIVYAGWSRVREGRNTYRFGELEPAAEGLFLKVSYLFRL